MANGQTLDHHAKVSIGGEVKPRNLVSKGELMRNKFPQQEDLLGMEPKMFSSEYYVNCGRTNEMKK